MALSGTHRRGEFGWQCVAFKLQSPESGKGADHDVMVGFDSPWTLDERRSSQVACTRTRDASPCTKKTLQPLMLDSHKGHTDSASTPLRHRVYTFPPWKMLGPTSHTTRSEHTSAIGSCNVQPFAHLGNADFVCLTLPCSWAIIDARPTPGPRPLDQ